LAALWPAECLSARSAGIAVGDLPGDAGGGYEAESPGHETGRAQAPSAFQPQVLVRRPRGGDRAIFPGKDGRLARNDALNPKRLFATGEAIERPQSPPHLVQQAIMARKRQVGDLDGGGVAASARGAGSHDGDSPLPTLGDQQGFS